MAKHDPYDIGNRIVIPGAPVGKGRPRLSEGHVYTPSKTRAWEKNAVWLFSLGKFKPMMLGPIRVEVEAYKQRPRAMMGKRYPPGRIWRTTTPDGDNVLKAVLDAMKKAGLMRDDNQCSDIRIRSWYTARDAVPCVEVRWEWIG